MSKYIGKSVLIVDDDPAILQSLQLRLEHGGYVVITAMDRSSACVKLRTFCPDVALFDINLPGGDGFKVAETLDRLSERRIPKIFITASQCDEFKTTASELGAVGFLEKPFASNVLFDAVEAALDSADTGDMNDNASRSSLLPQG